MKAAQIKEYGDPSVIEINEVDTPRVSTGKVLVEVHASSLNPFDSAVRAGYMKEMMPLQFPATLGGDIAGVVKEVSDDSPFAKGDKVYGQANVVAGNSGAFAEFALTAEVQVAKMPNNLNFEEAASLPLVGVSALQALTEHIKLKEGQKIFIRGGSGGIGTIAIQIAKHLGATVATTATGGDINRVKELGADEVVDYKSSDFSATLGQVDAVFDTVGGDDFNKALSIVKQGGIAVSMIAHADEDKANELGVTAITQATRATTDALNKLTELVESGVVKPQVSKTYSLDDISEAFRDRESGGVSGKIVIKIK